MKKQFRVHLKENQALKYLNKGSNSLTSVNADKENKTINELYPEHFKALRRTNRERYFPHPKKASDNLNKSPH